jgi:hypothetical protein
MAKEIRLKISAFPSFLRAAVCAITVIPIPQSRERNLARSPFPTDQSRIPRCARNETAVEANR